MSVPEAWALYDTRTGRRVNMSSMTEALALRHIARIRDRNLAAHLGVVRLTEETWGSRPGDVIA